jgi:RNA polymerase sigma-70 factor (sigma-E family)
MPPEAEREYVEYVSARLPRLHRAAFLLCGDAHRADDIVQATLTTLYLKWSRAAAADNLDGYVHRILVRRFLDEKRQRWSRVALYASTPEQGTRDDHGVEERDLVVTALRQLPKGQRAVLVLRFFCDLTVEVTAQVLGCSVGNVKSQSSRGLATLRRAMGVPETAGNNHRERN